MNLQPEFNPTFLSSSPDSQERRWILDALGDFYDGEWITDVLYRVKGGKEATVYCCQAHPLTGRKLLAAKIYRPRQFRKMKNDAIYKEGRALFDERRRSV